MAKRPPAPRMRGRELYKEVGKRVHCPAHLVETIVLTFEKLVYQCLINKIRVPFGTMGTFGFKIMPPRDFVEWNGWLKDGTPVVFYKNNTDGYLNFYFHFNRTFKRKLKDETLIPYGTMPSAQGNLERNAHSNIRVDYDKYLAQVQQEKETQFNESQQSLVEDDEELENDYSEYDDYDEYDLEDCEEEEIDETN